MRPSTSSSVTSWRASIVLGDRRSTRSCFSTYELGVGERLGEQLEVREPVLLEQRAREPRDRHVERRRARARGRTPRAWSSRTGSGRCRTRARRRGRPRRRRLSGSPSSCDEAAHEHAARGRVGVDHVDRAVALVRDVVVEDDELARRLGVRLEVAEAAERAAVERDHHLGLASGSRSGGVSRSRPGSSR